MLQLWSPFLMLSSIILVARSRARTNFSSWDQKRTQNLSWKKWMFVEGCKKYWMVKLLWWFCLVSKGSFALHKYILKIDNRRWILHSTRALLHQQGSQYVYQNVYIRIKIFCFLFNDNPHCDLNHICFSRSQCHTLSATPPLVYRYGCRTVRPFLYWALEMPQF